MLILCLPTALIRVLEKYMCVSYKVLTVLEAEKFDVLLSAC